MKLHLGTILEVFINIISFGWGKRISTYIAVDLMGYKDCGCCSTKAMVEQINR